MEEKIVLGVKNILGRLGIVGISESVVRWIRGFTPAGKHANEHRQKMVRFYSQFVHPGDLCFDVGANLGNRIEVFLNLGARVVAIEPQDNCMRYLRLRYRNPRQVVLIHKGLDEKVGEHELLVANESAVSSMSKDWVDRREELGLYHWDQKIVVPVTTLDSLIQDYGMPVFCKIDVEGFEYQVLKGLSRPIPALSFEYHSDFIDPVRSCVDHLTTLGTYEFNYSVGEGMLLALDRWVPGHEICDILLHLPKDDRAGDVYTRLKREQ